MSNVNDVPQVSSFPLADDSFVYNSILPVISVKLHFPLRPPRSCLAKDLKPNDLIPPVAGHPNLNLRP